MINIFRKQNNPFFNDNVEFIEINGVKWKTVNEGADKKNPAGVLYTIEEALALQNENWRLPTCEEVKQLMVFNKSWVEKSWIKRIDYNRTIIHTPNGNLSFPWNYKPKRFSDRVLIGGYWTSSYETRLEISNLKHYQLFEIRKEIFKLYGGIIPQLEIKVGVRLVSQ